VEKRVSYKRHVFNFAMNLGLHLFSTIENTVLSFMKIANPFFPESVNLRKLSIRFVSMGDC